MSERGKARYTYISVGSNSTVKSGSGTLYRVLSSNPSGSTVRVEDATDLGAAPDLNIGSANTVANWGGALLDFGPGTGFNTGLTLAATSNAKLTVVWE